MAFSAALMAVPVLAGRRRELKSLTRRDVLLCLASGLFLGIHFAAYFGALRATSIASAVVLVDTEVFFVAAASALFLGQRLPRRTWPAVLLAFAGSAVVALVVLLVNIKRPHKPMYVSVKAAGAGSADGDALAAQDAAPAEEGADVTDESANAETVSGSAGAEGVNAGGDERKD